ncbi:MAG: HAMP domain-containing sensor histidine kinase [Gemmatimonadota bacterium]
MPLPFRQRILLILILLGSAPTAAAILGWALTVRANNPATATRRAIEQVGASGRTLLQTIDSTRLTRAERRALAEHAHQLDEAMSRSQRADVYGSYYYAGLTVIILGFGAVVVYASVRLGGHLSRQLSRPIDELVGWTGNIRRHETLPADQPRRGAPEFAALRTALREMASGLEDGRQRELEAERLRAFREVARRVAHEMKNPLTPIRFAVAQLRSTATALQGESLEVLTAESERLEHLAREFTELGRLPEGPAAEVDLNELLGELARTSLPAGMEQRLLLKPETPHVMGHYDPLRRALSNMLRNAVEATGGTGLIEICTRGQNASAEVMIRDHGPGVPEAVREKIFEPYVTGRPDGTGLGLTLVRQTLEAHQGTIEVRETPGGGATFIIKLPGMKA